MDTYKHIQKGQNDHQILMQNMATQSQKELETLKVDQQSWSIP